MKKWIAIALVAIMMCAGLVSAQERRAFRLVFSRADVADVLRSIGLQTGAKIIYAVTPGATDTKRLVTIDVVADSAEEAIRATVSSAGLAFRRVENLFVVAEPQNMRQALSPYAVQGRYPVTEMTAEEAAAFLEKAIPTVTARTAGSRVLVIGILEDQKLARELLAEREAQLRDMETVSEVVILKVIPSDQAQRMLGTLYPSVKVSSSGTPNQAGGALALSGPRAEVEQAIKALSELDAPVVVPTPDLVYRVYDVRYASVNVIQKFVEDTFTGVKAFVAPESYTPARGQFIPLTGTIQSSLGSTTGGAGGGAQQGGAAGGGAAGGGGGSGGGSGDAFSSASGSTQPFMLTKPGDRSKRLVLRGTAVAVEAALAMLMQVDVKPIQVQVEVKVIDVSPEKLKQAGFDYSWAPFTGVEVPPGTGVDTTIPAPDLFDFAGSMRNLGLGAFSRVPWRIDAILNGLITKRDAKLLASPSVTVVDNDDANIFIGDTLRVQLTTAGGITGATSQIAEFPVGILLLLRPRVNADGNVTMRVHPTVSAVTGINDNLPQTSTREAETTVIVKDGETIVLGGLIREDMTRTVREVPFLADIPLLGELFKSRTTNHRRSDIMVFITTRIVKDGEKPAEPGKIGRGN